MEREHEKIGHIKSLDPNDPNISAQLGVCRFEPGEDAKVRRAKEEKVAESLQARPVDHDGEYIATRREDTHELHCIVWRDSGLWRRLSDWSEQMPESAIQHAEILFAPEAGTLH